MKILFIAPLPPPVHGSAMVSQYIKDSKLVQEQYDCDFVNLSTSRRMDEIGKGGMKKILRFVGAYFSLLWKLLTRRYDLCYLAITCHGIGFLKDAPFVLLCKLFRRKVLIHQHNKGMSGCVERWPYRWLLPLVYRNTTVMLLSWHLYDDIAAVVKREQVVVCPNGIPEQAVGHWPLAVGSRDDDNCAAELQANSQKPEANSQAPFSHTESTELTEGKSLRPCCHPDGNSSFFTLPSSLLETLHTTQNSAPRLLFLSNLIPSKGVYVLLDACRVLKERGLDFKCDFVGGESKAVSAEAFREAIAERGLADRVVYHGPKYGEEKEVYWQGADLFVQPTFDDCFPLTLVEAMQHRLPIVSTDVGAIPDMVEDGVNGFVCQQRDVDSLVTALERLITDPTLRQQMGERGYQRYLDLYTLEAFEKRFAMLIQQSCN